MKHPSSRLAAVLILAATALPAAALELGLEATTSNLQFPWTPASPIASTTFPTTNYFFGGQAYVSAGLGEDAAFRLSYERDPVLRNSFTGLVQFDRGITRISVGPLIGFLNSDSAPISAGLSTSIRFQWPGVAYVSMRSDGGTAVSLLQAGSDPQARTELSAGFYVPNAIVSALVSAKRFTELDAKGGLVTDGLTRYAVSVEAFKKNVPYTALASVGYELRSKSYATSGTTDGLGAVVLGLDASAELSRGLKLLGNFSSGAYVYGTDALKSRGPGNSAFFFSAGLGFAIDLDYMGVLKSGKATAKEASSGEAELQAPSATEQPASDAKGSTTESQAADLQGPAPEAQAADSAPSSP
jgi:hypothetical protein